MKKHHSVVGLAILIGTLLLSACGGGGNSDGGDTTPASILSGTAAGGAAIIGQVTIKDSLGATRSSPVDASTGAYSVDVTGMTPPFVLRARGTIGGREVQYHSYAQEADVGGTVNITPFTDLIIANASQQLASTFFDSGTLTSLDPADVAAQETALQAKLQAVFDVIGVGSAVDLLHTAFSADHSELDAVLDMVSITPDPAAPETAVIIKNLIDKTELTDAFNDPAETGTLAVNSTEEQISGIVSDNQAIAALIDSFSALFASALPTAAQVSALLSPDFLWDDAGASQTAVALSTDPGLVGVSFQGLTIDLDAANGTADVVFNAVYADILDPEPISLVVKKVNGTWLIAGDQEIVDRFHAFGCDQGDTGMACGMWIDVEDLDFTNNGTSGAPIASAKVSLLRDGVTVNDPATGNPAVIYMGTPAGSAVGELVIYDADYGDDYLDFNDARAFNLGIIQPGDVLQYELFTAALDTSAPDSPVINGAPLVTYLGLREAAAPHADPTTAGYPAATAATVTALNAYAGGNLTVAWTAPPTGQTISWINLAVCDATQCLTAELSEGQVFGKTEATLSLDIGALDQTATNYSATLRIDTKDSHAHEFQRDYVAQIAGPAAVATPAPSSGGGAALACSYQSGWDDTADGGLGAPITPNSFADYEAVIAACGTAQAFTAADVSGKTFQEVGTIETMTFNAGTGTATSPAPGVYDDGAGTTIAFQWYVEAATCTGCNYNYLVIYSDTTIDSSLPMAWLRETAALTGVTGTPGVPGAQYAYVKYSEQSNYSDSNRATSADGEIWNSVDQLQ